MKRKLTITFIGLSLVMAGLAVGIFEREKGSSALAGNIQTVNIFPSFVKSDSPTGEAGTGWNNTEASRIQHVSSDAILNDFNFENSSFIHPNPPSVDDKINIQNESLPSSNSSDSRESVEIIEQTPEISPSPTPLPEESPELPEGTPEGPSPPPAESPPPEPVQSESPVIPSETPISTPEVLVIPVESVEPVTPEAPPPVEPTSFLDFLLNSTAHAEEIIDDVAVEETPKPVSRCDPTSDICESASIEFSGFDVAGAFSDEPIGNMQLRLSLAAKPGPPSEEVTASMGLLTIEYFYSGKWYEAGALPIDEEMSNAVNGGYYLFALPVVGSWDVLGDMRIRVIYSSLKGSKDEIYLDSAWLEIEAGIGEDGPEGEGEDVLVEEDAGEDEDNEETEPEFNLDLVSERDSFTLDDAPVFNFKYQRDKGFFELIGYLILKFLHVGNTGMTVQIVDSLTGEPAEILYNDDGQFSVQLNATRTVKPGRHRLQIKITDNGREYYSEKDFLWGGVVANLNKARYRAGQTAVVGIGVLNDIGATMCEAEISASVVAPDGSLRSFNTKDGSIRSSGICNPERTTSTADFTFSYIIPNIVGQYTVEIDARTVNGPRSITNTFEVFESVPLNITRHGSMRAVPGSDVSMRFTVVAPEEGFRGPVEERIPSRFQVFQPREGILRYTSVREEGDSRVILWEVNLDSGESIEIGYSLRIPDTSPALHLLGPLRIHDLEEAWLWQISVDGPLRDQKPTSGILTQHSCEADPFTQSISPGAKAIFPIKLSPSLAETPFTVSLGDLPNGVTGSINPADGVASQDTRVEAIFSVNPDARSGSTSILVAYEERRKDGRIESASCQVNLIIQ